MKNYDLIKNEKVWSGTKSNVTFMHAFLSGPDQPAACRKNIRSGGGVLLAASARARTMLPTNYCESCEAAVIAMVNRREASMEPSTGEGDYLPPAETNTEKETGMDTTKPVRVRVTLILDVDPEAWELDYGVSGRREIQEDVKEYVRNAVVQGPAGFENMKLVSAQ